MDRLIRLAELLAAIGMATAFVAALGPIGRVSEVYSSPPSTVPAEHPARMWYAPLLLSARVPERITASLPCAASPALRAGRRLTVLLSTARFPQRSGGLAVIGSPRSLRLNSGAGVVARVPARPVGVSGSCSYRLEVENRR